MEISFAHMCNHVPAHHVFVEKSLETDRTFHIFLLEMRSPDMVHHERFFCEHSTTIGTLVPNAMDVDLVSLHCIRGLKLLRTL